MRAHCCCCRTFSLRLFSLHSSCFALVSPFLSCASGGSAQSLDAPLLHEQALCRRRIADGVLVAPALQGRGVKACAGEPLPQESCRKRIDFCARVGGSAFVFPAPPRFFSVSVFSPIRRSTKRAACSCPWFCFTYAHPLQPNSCASLAVFVLQRVPRPHTFQLSATTCRNRLEGPRGAPCWQHL